jgi:hypothetical protein
MLVLAALLVVAAGCRKKAAAWNDLETVRRRLNAAGLAHDFMQRPEWREKGEDFVREVYNNETGSVTVWVMSRTGSKRACAVFVMAFTVRPSKLQPFPVPPWDRVRLLGEFLTGDRIEGVLSGPAVTKLGGMRCERSVRDIDGTSSFARMRLFGQGYQREE